MPGGGKKIPDVLRVTVEGKGLTDSARLAAEADEYLDRNYERQIGSHDHRPYYRSIRPHLVAPSLSAGGASSATSTSVYYVYFCASKGHWRIGPELGGEQCCMYCPDPGADAPHVIVNTWQRKSRVGPDWDAVPEVTIRPVVALAPKVRRSSRGWGWRYRAHTHIHTHTHTHTVVNHDI